MQTRAFAAVLFRRIASKTRKDPVKNEARELFSTLTTDQRLVIRQKLVTCLTTESGTDVRKKIGDAVAELARQYTDNGMLNTRSSSLLFLFSFRPGSSFPNLTSDSSR